MSYDNMSDVTRIQMLRSEINVSPVVYDAATKILVGYISNNEVTNDNAVEMLEKSVKLALDLAIITEKLTSKTTDQGAHL